MSANGWLLYLNDALQVAVGARELIYVLPEEPEIHSVPLAPSWSPGVIVWENRLVPVIDAGELLQEATCSLTSEPAAALAVAQRFAAIVAFAREGELTDDNIELGALLLRRVPAQVAVTDDQACELPANLAGFNFFNSCFEQPEFGSVPILNLTALFSGSQHRMKAS